MSSSYLVILRYLACIVDGQQLHTVYMLPLWVFRAGGGCREEVMTYSDDKFGLPGWGTCTGCNVM